ncbi:restriction endonuclease [Herbaspirillum sp. alder98]|uniref:restriction endonuclease n=1 Tax=Herbaspirillum sp. alder98 TaxID=2913096 RepID=UPI001CD90E6B|nr:restriction endonuclease [Herbaspirillum sp. alder98]MCA1325145.1 restriction endonuclease [Herbaspirillum sp. alder98]
MITAKNNLASLIGDWGGFERLIAQLHETGDVNVQHNVTLVGKSGAPRQIDVLVRHREGFYEHLIVVECKYRNSPIERLHVDALTTTIRDVGASRGVIFSTEGFQSGAITQAKFADISLFKIRELTDREWGLPGRRFDMWMHFISLGIGNLKFARGYSLGSLPASDTQLQLHLGTPEQSSRTRILVNGKTETTLENLLEKVARKSAQAMYQADRYDFDGQDEGVIRRVGRVKYHPKTHMELLDSKAPLFLPGFDFDLGIHLEQSRLQLDRSESYTFALAVEDCIQETVFTASRGTEESQTTLKPSVRALVNEKDVYKNGSLATLWLSGWKQFSEFEGIQPDPVGASVEVQLKLSDELISASRDTK